MGELSVGVAGGAVVVAGAAGVGTGYGLRKATVGTPLDIDKAMQSLLDWALGDADTAYAREHPGVLTSGSTVQGGPASSQQPTYTLADDPDVDVDDVCGRSPINGKYAGKQYPLSPDLQAKYPQGVRFTSAGFPDFSPYAVAGFDSVAAGFQLTGDYKTDAAAANAGNKFDRTPEGYVWHHAEDCQTMLLIPQDLHGAVRHTDSAARIRCGECVP